MSFGQGRTRPEAKYDTEKVMFRDLGGSNVKFLVDCEGRRDEVEEGKRVSEECFGGKLTDSSCFSTPVSTFCWLCWSPSSVSSSFSPLMTCRASLVLSFRCRNRWLVTGRGAMMADAGYFVTMQKRVKVVQITLKT